MQEVVNPKKQILEQIENNGGWVNSHTHLDRSQTLTQTVWGQTGARLQDKWGYVDQFKSEASVDDIVANMSQTIEDQISQGVQAIGSFIDCDSVVRDKSLRAAEIVRERFRGRVALRFMSQPIKGLVDPAEIAWFEHAADFVDIIGGLPEKDGNPESAADNSHLHFHKIFETAAETGKPLHIHIDQLNRPDQRDTERALDFVERYELYGRVCLIHCISLAAQSENYRLEIYERMVKLGVGVITCPTAWIDSRRTNQMAPTHNAVTAVDEMVPRGVTVALGTDNIADIYKPFTDGDMWTELRFLLETTHFYDIKALARVSSTNGLKVLGLSDRPRPIYA
ncbi:amidohydrolase family protein [Candidatus Saccharibacteria bacterium]|nr:amidohydrolase family protein [Candidatus Saccharibacteria bacterium]MCB9821077.1 amidohydrolase family protein [Candidatus Nomurabacteria bacterium]